MFWFVLKIPIYFHLHSAASGSDRNSFDRLLFRLDFAAPFGNAGATVFCFFFFNFCLNLISYQFLQLAINCINLNEFDLTPGGGMLQHHDDVIIFTEHAQWTLNCLANRVTTWSPKIFFKYSKMCFCFRKWRARGHVITCAIQWEIR